MRNFLTLTTRGSGLWELQTIGVGRFYVNFLTEDGKHLLLSAENPVKKNIYKKIGEKGKKEDPVYNKMKFSVIINNGDYSI